MRWPRPPYGFGVLRKRWHSLTRWHAIIGTEIGSAGVNAFAFAASEAPRPATQIRQRASVTSRVEGADTVVRSAPYCHRSSGGSSSPYLARQEGLSRQFPPAPLAAYMQLWKSLNPQLAPPAW